MRPDTWRIIRGRLRDIHALRKIQKIFRKAPRRVKVFFKHRSDFQLNRGPLRNAFSNDDCEGSIGNSNYNSLQIGVRTPEARSAFPFGVQGFENIAASIDVFCSTLVMLTVKV